MQRRLSRGIRPVYELGNYGAGKTVGSRYHDEMVDSLTGFPV